MINAARCGLLALLYLLATLLWATPAKDADEDIKQLYQSAPPSLQGVNRLAWFSQQLLGKPYLGGPLGEGPKGRYDTFPLYRLDAFDCVTYVETTLALALGHDLASFKQYLLALRYANGRPDFIDRNHFMSVDWNPNNIAKGFIRDKTTKVVNTHGLPVTKTSDAIINFRSWVDQMAPQLVRLKEDAHKPLRQAALKKQAQTVPSRLSHINYLPLNVLFDAQGKPRSYYFDQIPSGALIEIVRPNWQLKDRIGTNLQVSHLGWAFRNAKHRLIFREASSQQGKVMDIPLSDYLANTLTSPTVKGIAIFTVAHPGFELK